MPFLLDVPREAKQGLWQDHCHAHATLFSTQLLDVQTRQCHALDCHWLLDISDLHALLKIMDGATSIQPSASDWGKLSVAAPTMQPLGLGIDLDAMLLCPSCLMRQARRPDKPCSTYIAVHMHACSAYCSSMSRPASVMHNDHYWIIDIGDQSRSRRMPSGFQVILSR